MRTKTHDTILAPISAPARMATMLACIAVSALLASAASAEDTTMTAAGALLRGSAPPGAMPAPSPAKAPVLRPAETRNETATVRANADAPEPPSPRAAAAAERAARALAEEDGSQFDGGAPAETELLPVEAPAAPVPQGQPVTSADVKRNSASAKSAVCIAGCY